MAQVDEQLTCFEVRGIVGLTPARPTYFLALRPPYGLIVNNPRTSIQLVLSANKQRMQLSRTTIYLARTTPCYSNSRLCMAPRTREQWLADQTRPMPAVGTADLSGKMLVLIGANTGLGFKAAKHFAKASFSIGVDGKE